MARRRDEDATRTPVAGPNRWRGDRPVPGIPRPHLLSRGGEHVVVLIAQNPILLRLEIEVVDPPRDLVRLAPLRDVNGLEKVVVRLLARALGRILARMVGELPADHVQVVCVGAIGASNTTVPAGESRAAACSPANSSGSIVLMVLTCTMRSTVAR